MSRSYKRTPYVGLTKDKFFKNYANRKLRRLPLDELPLQHNSYKKNFSSYDICDYEWTHYSFEAWWRDAVARWKNYGYRYEPYPSREEEYRLWYRWYKMK